MKNKYYLVGEEYKRWKQYRNSEIYGYTYIPSFPYSQSVTTPVEVMLDSSKCYQRYNHPLWLYFKNGYLSNSEWTPLILDGERCYVPLLNYDLKIVYIHFARLCAFVQKFFKLITALAEKEVDYEDFSACVRGITSIDNLCVNENYICQKANNKSPINEMAIVGAKRTGLPRDIWVDNGRIWFHKTKHGPRMKFEEPKNSDSEGWPCIAYAKEGKHKVDHNTPIDDIDVLAKEDDLKYISTTEINQLKYFVRANIDLLHTMMDDEYPMEFFLTQFKKVDENGNIIYDPNQTTYITGKEIIPGISLVTDKETGKHNFVKDGKLLSPKWFDFFKSFKECNGKQRIEVFIDGQRHFLYTDGTFE